ncbi:hypothetical protein GPN2_12279 [Streptomyces murinus]
MRGWMTTRPWMGWGVEGIPMVPFFPVGGAGSRPWRRLPFGFVALRLRGCGGQVPRQGRTKACWRGLRMSDTADINVFLGLDVGKGEHPVTVGTSAGEEPFDKRPPPPSPPTPPSPPPPGTHPASWPCATRSDHLGPARRTARRPAGRAGAGRRWRVAARRLRRGPGRPSR